MNRYWISLAAALAGCGTKETPAAPSPQGSQRGVVDEMEHLEPECKEGVAEKKPTCSASDCGPNSPNVNSFPINGLDTGGKGKCNPSSVFIVPGSLSGGGCPNGSSLVYEKGRLVGRKGDLKCERMDLTGATFVVRALSGGSVVFTIAGVRLFKPIGMEADPDREGYRIEVGGQSACVNGTSEWVSRRLGSQLEDLENDDDHDDAVSDANQTVTAKRKRKFATDRSDGGTKQPPPVSGGWEFGMHDEDLVVPIEGPLYDATDKTLDTYRTGFYNLACVGDALAKREFYKLSKSGEAVNDEYNETALKMLTAKYCVNKKDRNTKAWTTYGMPIEWLKTEMPVREARWKDRKAKCLKTPRLMEIRDEDGEPISPKKFGRKLQPKGCWDKARKEGKCTTEQWRTALLATCKDPLPECVAGDTDWIFESSVLTPDATRLGIRVNDRPPAAMPANSR